MNIYRWWSDDANRLEIITAARDLEKARLKIAKEAKKKYPGQGKDISELIAKEPWEITPAPKWTMIAYLD